MRGSLKVWVAGLGSEYRGDGAAGIILAGHIHRFLAGEPGVEASLFFELFPAFPAPPEKDCVDLIVLCDADSVSRGEGFDVSEFSFDPRNPGGIYAYSAGAEWFLALAKRGTTAGKALLFTVSGDSFDFSENPTPACAERIKNAEEKFRRLWRDYSGWRGCNG